MCPWQARFCYLHLVISFYHLRMNFVIPTELNLCKLTARAAPETQLKNRFEDLLKTVWLLCRKVNCEKISTEWMLHLWNLKCSWKLFQAFQVAPARSSFLFSALHGIFHSTYVYNFLIKHCEWWVPAVAIEFYPFYGSGSYKASLDTRDEKKK